MLLGGRAGDRWIHRMLVLTWVLVLPATEFEAHPTVHDPPLANPPSPSTFNIQCRVILTNRNSTAPQQFGHDRAKRKRKRRRSPIEFHF